MKIWGANVSSLQYLIYIKTIFLEPTMVTWCVLALSADTQVDIGSSWGGNSPVSSEVTVVQQKVREEEKKERQDSWVLREQQRVRGRRRDSRGKKRQHQRGARLRKRRAGMTARQNSVDSTVTVHEMTKFRRSNQPWD